MKKNKDRTLSTIVAFSLLLFLPSINFYITSIPQLNFGGALTMIVYILMAVLGCYSYNFLSKTDGRIRTLILLLTFGTLFSYFVYPQIRKTLINPSFNPLESSILMMYLYCIPLLIFSSICNNWMKFVKFSYVLSIITIVIALLSYYIEVLILGIIDRIDYMSFSYYLLPSFCFCLLYGVLLKDKKSLVFAVIALLLIAIVGSRGALLSALTMLTLIIIRVSSKRYIIPILTVFFFIVYVILIQVDDISSSVNDYLGNYGTYSRNLSKLTDGSFSESEGRVMLRKIANNEIENNFLGFGLYGDRTFLMRYGYKYVHNIFLEFILDFGVVLGCILLTVLLFNIIKKILTQSKGYYLMAAVFSCNIKLLFSGTYLNELFFYMLIGIMINKSVWRDELWSK